MNYYKSDSFGEYTEDNFCTFDTLVETLLIFNTDFQ